MSALSFSFESWYTSIVNEKAFASPEGNSETEKWLKENECTTLLSLESLLDVPFSEFSPLKRGWVGALKTAIGKLVNGEALPPG